MHRMNKAKEARRRARKTAQKPGAQRVIPDRRAKLLNKAKRKDEE